MPQVRRLGSNSFVKQDHVVLCDGEPLGAGTAYLLASEPKNVVKGSLKSPAIVRLDHQPQGWPVWRTRADLSCDACDNVTGAASDRQSVRSAPVAIGIHRLSTLAKFQDFRGVNHFL